MSVINLESISTNDEILKALAFYCSLADSLPKYAKYIETLANKYDTRIETIPLPVQILSLRTEFSITALHNFYSVMKDYDFYSIYRDVIHYYQNDISAPVYFENLREVFRINYDEDFIRETITFINSPIPLPKEREKIDKDNGNEGLDETIYEKVNLNGISETRSVITADERDQIKTQSDLMYGPGIDAMLRHLYAQLDNVAEYSDKPIYIQTFDIHVEKLKFLKEKEINKYMSVEEIADYIITQMQFGEDTEFEIAIDDISKSDYPDDASYNQAKDEYVRTKLLDKLKTLNFAQLDELTQKFSVSQQEINEVQDDIDLFRIFGPVNPYSDMDFSELTTFNSEGVEEPDENKIYGGPRMFLDSTGEYDEENDEHLTNWFSGSCINCHKKIRHKHYAVRLPVITGGWFGCYCSWDCVREYTITVFENSNVKYKIDPEENENEDDNDDNENEEKTSIQNSHITQLTFIDTFEDQMIKNGIADREDEEVVDIQNKVDNNQVMNLQNQMNELLIGRESEFDLPEINTSVLEEIPEESDEE